MVLLCLGSKNRVRQIYSDLNFRDSTFCVLHQVFGCCCQGWWSYCFPGGESGVTCAAVTVADQREQH